MNILNWIKKNKFECAVFVVIVAIASFLRFYRIGDYMTFLGDEGRDALMVKRILTTFDIPLIGPPTSVGNVYLGPLYYYMMSVSMAIFWLNPVAASSMVALIGVLSVALVYYLARSWFGIVEALAASLLYSASSVAVIYSRSSWNPNPAPFFALVGVTGFHLARKSRNGVWLILSGGALAFALQMHYLALILIPIFATLWAWEAIIWRKSVGIERNFRLGSIGALFAFLIFMSPLLVFDLKHDFMNLHALQALFAGDSIGFNFVSFLGGIAILFTDNLIGRYLTADIWWLKYLFSAFVLVPVAAVFRAGLNMPKWPVFALGVWLVLGISGVNLYRKDVFDHYLGFVSPAPFLLIGATVYLIKTLGRGAKMVYGIVLLVGSVVAVGANIAANPLQYPPNRQLQRTQGVAQFIINESQNRPFNFALIAENNYDAAYMFYMDTYGHKPKELPFEKTKQLFVVCEDTICKPVGHPKHEIAAFGWVKIVQEWEVYGVKIYKLVDYYE